MLKLLLSCKAAAKHFTSSGATMQSESQGKLERLVFVTARLGVGALFVFTGYFRMRPLLGPPWSIASLKISLAMFAISLDEYGMLPTWANVILSHVLPFLELGLGACLIVGIALRLSSALSALVTMFFFVADLVYYLRCVDCGPSSPFSFLAVKAVPFLLCVCLVVLSFRWDARSARAIDNAQTA